VQKTNNSRTGKKKKWKSRRGAVPGGRSQSKVEEEGTVEIHTEKVGCWGEERGGQTLPRAAVEHRHGSPENKNQHLGIMATYRHWGKNIGAYHTMMRFQRDLNELGGREGGTKPAKLGGRICEF